MIILTGSQKGGCGKSTLATNLATSLALMGRDVILIDADRQGSVTKWVQDRIREDVQPRISTAILYDNIREQVIDLSRRFQDVVVDTAGRDSVELRTGLLAADVVLVPFKPSPLDIDTFPKIVEMIEQSKIINSSLKTLAVFTMAPTNPSVTEEQDNRRLLMEFAALPLANTVIHERKVYRDVLYNGNGVVEVGNDKAAEEIMSLLEEVLNV